MLLKLWRRGAGVSFRGLLGIIVEGQASAVDGQTEAPALVKTR